VKVRQATPDDADAIIALAKEFSQYMQSLGDTIDFRFDAASYRRDGFGDNPAFQRLVAEVDNDVVGYLLYHHGYDTDLAIRTLHVIDLYVRPANRLSGVGRALMTRAAEICTATGGKQLFWSVYLPNRPAFDFYERLGARRFKDMEYMYLPLEGETGR
jgi:GNAT superfamily N-acetyltransferase